MGILLAMLGCSDFSLNQIEPAGPPPVVVPVVEHFVQQPLSQVDLLFVVDDTASMQLELDALGSQLPALLQTLDVFEMDWQIGVVSADVSSAWPGYLLGAPYVLTPASTDPQLAFQERLPSFGGSGESGIEAATLALELAQAGGPNAGFLRNEAVLQVLFVSDADDQSVGDDPVAALLEVMAEVSGSRGGRISALVGDAPAGCASPSGTAQPGFRYLELVSATDGRSGSICTIDFQELLIDLADDSVELPTVFPLRNRPFAQSLFATIDGRSATWAYDAVQNAVVFETAPPSGAVVEVRYAWREGAP